MAPGILRYNGPSSSGSSEEGLQYTPQSVNGAISNEPIAIVGMACRLPGEAHSPSRLWDLLSESRSGQCDIPGSRLNINGFYSSKAPDRPGSMSMKGGYFLNEDVRSFENDFFGISNLEATYMDPQQRKLLEVVFESFESAGATLNDVSESNTGCYVGNFTVDYQVIQTTDSEYLSRYSATGMGTTILGNRISHAFNMKGPSLVLDTACSSSLYCLHTACVALSTGECDAAVVAGANLIQSPEQHFGTMKAGVLSKTSTCHTFDSSADGYGRADGIGALYVKRLSDALRNNDPIRSIIRGTAVNSNGKTSGITLPDAIGQETVIRKAYDAAGLDLSSTSYVECHGTGTLVGDPIEVEALASTFAGHDHPLLIGSVKTNLGHSEAASGISSIIKTTLALENGIIPPTIGLRNINPKLKLEERNVQVVTENTPFPRIGGLATPFRAGVNSFGYGGSNAHVILEEPYPWLPPDYAAYNSSIDQSPVANPNEELILPISTTKQRSLKTQVEHIKRFWSQRISIDDLAYTLGCRRTHMLERGFIISSQSTLEQDLNPENLIVKKQPNGVVDAPWAFVFTGQGAQWPQMGKQLIEQSPIFRRTIRDLDDILSRLPHAPKWSLLDALLKPSETSKINEVAHAQPACTAIQIALVDLLHSWNIAPRAVIGHSSGEIAAAYASGYISAEEAIIAAYYRGYVVDQMSTRGAMMAAGLCAEECVKLIEENTLTDKIRVACVNSPESVTLSGDADAVEIMLEVVKAKGVLSRKLLTDGRAYHSHQMLSISEVYESLLDQAFAKVHAHLSPRNAPTAMWFSSVTTAPAGSRVDARYWRDNLENPVLFGPALEVLLESGSYQLLELGPHSAMKMPISQLRQKLKRSDADVPYFNALTRGENSMRSLLKCVGNMWLSGIAVDFDKVNSVHKDTSIKSPTKNAVLHDLPPYPWSYDDTLWVEARASEEFRNRRYPRHELLGSVVPGMNKIEHTWRNKLSVRDVGWLQDHKLDQTVVFPGAGYVAMAIEGVQQACQHHIKVAEGSVHIRSMKILEALVLPSGPLGDVEMFTTLRPLPISAVVKSRDWWLFEISSIQGVGAVIHSTGEIRLVKDTTSISRKTMAEDSILEPNAIRNWYDALIKSGLNFGDSFRSMKQISVDRQRVHTVARADTELIPHQIEADEDCFSYAVHPITLDSMLQTSILASTAGRMRSLRAKVPVCIGEAYITRAASLTQSSWHVDSKAESMGFGTTNVSADLFDTMGQVAATFTNVELAPYQGAAQDEVYERHPMLRVTWKPDLLFDNLQSSSHFWHTHLDNTRQRYFKALGETTASYCAMLDLIVHKSPRLRILELGNTDRELTRQLLSTLRIPSAFSRCTTYSVGAFCSDSSVHAKKIQSSASLDDSVPSKVVEADHQYDLILLPNSAPVDGSLGSRLPLLKQLLSPRGVLLAHSSSQERLLSAEDGFEASQHDLRNGSIVLARKPAEATKIPVELPAELSEVYIIEKSSTSTSTSPLNDALYKVLGYLNLPVQRIEFDTLTDLTPKAAVFFTVELENPLLASISDADNTKIKTITDNASTIIWVTGGHLYKGRQPECALANGLARALMLEQPSTQIVTYDVDDDAHTDAARTAANICAAFTQLFTAEKPDYEFAQHDGLAHVSRFEPDAALNEVFRSKQDAVARAQRVGLARDTQLHIDQPGQFDTIRFVPSTSGPLAADALEVEVRAVGLNAKDLYVLAGKIGTQKGTCALEFAGVVKSVGSAVASEEFAIGDPVVCVAPSHFRLTEHVPAWACHKLLPSEDFCAVATLGVVYATALYGLDDRARLQPGESVLIHSGAGGVGIAAIQIAKMRGAEIFTTVSTREKREYLVNAFGVKPENIFNSSDGSFLQGIMRATQDRGVDVVLNSLTGDLLRDSWRCCADFGRFVEIGKRDIMDSGNLDMAVFLRNVTFSAFDLSNVYYSDNVAMHRTWSRLLSTTMELYRGGKITDIRPLKTFDISHITDAYRYFSSRNRMGKVAISVENADSIIKATPRKYQSTFSPSKVYLMVGCLGGLGRSISKWMVSRGAHKFVFLGRSGADKPAARSLVEDLERASAHVTVVRGDICIEEDVQAAVDAAVHIGALGGVVQAAMGLSESLFTTMPNSAWHTGIDPKVQGTWFLHKSTLPHSSSLDFFLLTSSVSGSVGTATESNYCAANSFLDAFARFRRGQGLPATSLGLGMISEVGYLHENPEVEALLLRKGIQAVNEDELLQIIDAALSTNVEDTGFHDEGSRSHILTGLEPLGLKELRKKGFEGNNPTLSDPRAALLASALNGEEGQGSDGSATAGGGANGFLPLELVKALEETTTRRSASADDDDDDDVGDAVLTAIDTLIRRRFSNLVLLQLDRIDVDRPLAGYGMDSMIAAEFRTWFFTTFKVDVPFLELLSKSVTLRSLARLVRQELSTRFELEGS